jgi:hypothetical protein
MDNLRKFLQGILLATRSNLDEYVSKGRIFPTEVADKKETHILYPTSIAVFETNECGRTRPNYYVCLYFLTC